MEFLILMYRSCKYLNRKLSIFFSKIITSILFRLNRVKHKNFTTKGIPFVLVNEGGVMEIGKNFDMLNTRAANPIGREHRCSFFVREKARLIIGDNVGLGATAIVCFSQITIEDNVRIGGNTCIYDTDFHSLNYKDRQFRKSDVQNTMHKPVHIKKNAFIGAHTTILKGTTVGENSIVGACSVVSRNIPDNQIWAGNPAKFIKTL
jgi:acetyltransferase-like isoleucine patch superfamily enzyme